MKVLLVVDGSSSSDIATKTLGALSLPSQTEVIVMTVVPEHTFLGGITFDRLKGNTAAKRKAQEEEATNLLSEPVQFLGDIGLKVESLVRWGNPAQVILKAADERGASLIVMGAKGLTNYPAFRLGSVTQTVMKHAGVSILIARKKTMKVQRHIQPTETAVTVDRVLVATDGSRYSDMAIKFLLDLPLPKHSQIIVLTALQSYIAALLNAPALDPDTDVELLNDLREAEESEALRIVEKSRQQFESKGYKTSTEALRGAAGESILEAADEHNPDIIVMGSRGLSGIESFFLGSVSERVVRHAPCSVLVVKPPKK